MAVTGSTKTIQVDNDAVTASTRTRRVIIVGATGNESAHIVAAVERLKRERDTEVELISPEEAVERGITITNMEVFAPEPFIITNPRMDNMYLDYDGKYDLNKKGKRGYTRPYKYHK
jgi:hypothetical protein